MQITDEMVEAAWKEYMQKRHATNSQAMRAALEAALGVKSSRSLPTLRCIVTGHIVGTDTRMIGKPCECPTCIAAACVEDLVAALKPFAALAFSYDPPEDDDNEIVWDYRASPKLGNLRKARDILERWGLK